MTRLQRQVHAANRKILSDAKGKSTEEFQREYEERMKKLGVDVNDTGTWSK